MMPTSGTRTSWRTGTTSTTRRNTQVPTRPKTPATPIFPMTAMPGANTVVTSMPSIANSLTPVVPGSTNLLRTSICMISPAMPREAPTRTTATVRGIRLTPSRKAPLLAGPPASTDAGDTSETPTNRLATPRTARRAPTSTPAQARPGRARGEALVAVVASAVTDDGGGARRGPRRSPGDLQDVVDHDLRGVDATEDDVP